MSLAFVRSKEPISENNDIHGQIFHTDKAIIPQYLMEFFKTSLPGSPDITVAKLVCSHHGCQRCMGVGDCIKIENHTIKKLLQTADRCDISNPSDLGKQKAEDMWHIGLFGSRIKINPFNFDEKRYKLYHDLTTTLNATRNFQELEKLWTGLVLMATNDVLSETRYNGTDLTLAGHLLSTAILFSLLVQSNQIYLATCPNNRRSREKLLESFSARYVAHDKRTIAVLSSQINEWLTIWGVYEAFDEIGPWLAKVVPKAKPSPDKVLGLCRTSWVKRPENIGPGCDMDDLVADLKRFVNLTKLQDIKQITLRRLSLMKHIANLKKARDLGKLDTKMIAFIIEKEKILADMDEKISESETISQILTTNKWLNESSAYTWAWDLLSKIMSPIRPSSPIKWARRMMSENSGPTEEDAVRWVLGKRFTLGRWFCAKLEWMRLEGINNPEKILLEPISLSYK